MTLKDLYIGLKLELEVPDDYGEHNKMVSNLEVIESKRDALISIPMSEGLFHPLPRGTRFEAYFILKLDVYRVELYSFRGMVTGKVKEDNVLLLRIHADGVIKKVQRREFYRAQCSLDIMYYILDDFKGDVNEEPEFVKTITRNLSGGGVCMLLKDKIPVWSMIECILCLEERKIRFKGKVVRTGMRESEGIFDYEAGISFEDIDDSDREEIVKFVFREQRRMRRKGLI